MRRREARWQRLRFSLGFAQMTGAVLAAVLLVTEGPTHTALFAAVLTTLLTAASILLFGRGRSRR
jgi:hypothetical protein